MTYSGKPKAAFFMILKGIGVKTMKLCKVMWNVCTNFQEDNLVLEICLWTSNHTIQFYFRHAMKTNSYFRTIIFKFLKDES